jgi:hypothetical protein
VIRRKVLAFVSVLVIVGCRGIVGIEDGPPTSLVPDAATCAVPFAAAGADCAQCLATSCCEEGERCKSAPQCGDLSGCLLACTARDIACESLCRARFPKGYGVEGASLDSCKATHCARACEVTCGGYVYAEAECGNCGNTRCCDVATACMNDVECAMLAACERACPVADSSCLGMCELAYPDGVTRERAFGTCLTEFCSPTCIAPKWACLVPPIETPAPATGINFTVTYRLFGYGPGGLDGQGGFRVQACGTTDVEACAQPIAGPVFTNDFGQAKLELKGDPFNGYAKITKAGFAPVFVYLPRDLAKDFVADVGVVAEDTFAGLANAVLSPQTLESDRANLLVSVVDCAGGSAAGVKFQIADAAGSTQFYFGDGLPDKTRTQTKDDMEIGSVGGFLNVRGGTGAGITVRATVAENGLAYSERTVQAPIEPNGYTLLLLYAASP